MTLRSNYPFGYAITAFVALLWLGLLLGVSFLATPVKFLAPSLDLAVALDVGRVTFSAFSKLEWVLSLFLLATTFMRASPRAQIALAVAPVSVVAVQAVWLLPALNVRVDAIISGAPLSNSLHHAAYATLEVVKAINLAFITILALWKLGSQNSTNVSAGTA